MTSPQRVLIIDDNVYMTSYICRILTSNGFHVMAENNSVLASTTAEYFNPNLILLDVNMPGKDGGDVAQELKDNPKTADVPVIYFTAMVGEDEMVAEYGKAGTEYYVPKTIEPALLVSIVKRFLCAANNDRNNSPGSMRGSYIPSARSLAGKSL